MSVKAKQKSKKMYRVEFILPKEARSSGRAPKTRVKFIEGVETKTLPLYIDYGSDFEPSVVGVLFAVLDEDGTHKFEVSWNSLIDVEVVDQVASNLKVVNE